MNSCLNCYYQRNPKEVQRCFFCVNTGTETNPLPLWSDIEKKQTNGDKIRHSTDEEIAEMVAKEIAYLPGTILEWLKQEAQQ